jgi:hypothetical protein
LDKALLNEKGFVINIVGDGELKNDYLELIKQYHLEKYFIFKGKLF